MHFEKVRKGVWPLWKFQKALGYTDRKANRQYNTKNISYQSVQSVFTLQSSSFTLVQVYLLFFILFYFLFKAILHLPLYYVQTYFVKVFCKNGITIN